MRQLLAAALFVGAGALSTGAVHAMPAASVDTGAAADITQVAGGCGPGFHPSPWGCRPFHRPPPPRYWHRRWCRPGWRWGPRGCFR